MSKKLSLSSILAVSLLSGCASDINTTWCEPIAPKVETINLAADALFKFNKYAESDLLTRGKLTLDNLAKQLSTGYAQVDKISVIGHTDRLGSASYNYQLGLNRANTVKQYLVARGINAAITTGSAGKKQPVTDGCFSVSPKAKLTACLQPDRRVAVNVTGVKKIK